MNANIEPTPRAPRPEDIKDLFSKFGEIKDVCKWRACRTPHLMHPPPPPPPVRPRLARRSCPAALATADIPKDYYTKVPRGFAYVQYDATLTPVRVHTHTHTHTHIRFEDDRDADDALEKMDGADVSTRPVPHPRPCPARFVCVCMCMCASTRAVCVCVCSTRAGGSWCSSPRGSASPPAR